MSTRTVIHYIDSRELGGTERAMLVLSAGLAASTGWRPIIAHRDAPELARLVADARSMGIETLALPMLDAPLPLGIARLARVLRKVRPVVFHAHLPWPAAGRRGLLAAALVGVPGVVATAQLYVPLESRLQRLKARLVRVDRYLAVSRAVADGLRELGIDERRISVVYNAGASTVGIPGPAPVRGTRTRNSALVTVGRLVEQKGHSVLLEALAGLPGVSLAIAGDGPLKPQLQATVERLGLVDRVQFLGQVAEVGEVLARADIFVLTSVNEGLPLAVVEAMAAGLPVVATRVGGTPEVVIDEETGLLVEAGDIPATRAAIARLINDPELAARMGRRGQDVARERFSAGAMVQRVIAVYEDVLSRRSRTSRPALRRVWARHALRAEPESRTATGAETEAVRNVVLRRADWRFLLPDPLPGTTVCYASGSLREAVGMVSERLVEPAAARGDCDLAVIEVPDRHTLRAAWEALRPGGTCYSEWHGARIGRRAIGRRLEEAGFDDVKGYWPWPRLSEARAWLPLDSPPALRYYFSTRQSQSTVAGRLLHAAARRLVRGALEAGLATPIAVVARKPVTAANGQSNSVYVTDRVGPVQRTWIHPVSQDSARASGWLLLTGGPRTVSKAVGLAFARLGPVPSLAVKMNRTPEAREGIVHEAEMLEFLARERPSLAGVPRPRAFEDRGRLVLLGESPVVGRPLHSELRGSTFSRHAQTVTDWLIALAGSTEAVSRQAWWPRLVEPTLTTFEAQFGAILGTREREACRAALDGLPDLPLVPEQRDMGPWNLVLGTGGLGVLDWESAEPLGLPALDLIYFLVYAAFYVDGALTSGAFLDAYRAVRESGTRLGAIAHACLSRYCREVGVPAGALRQLHLLAWIIHARSEHRRLVEDAGGPPTERALRNAVLPSLWQAELQVA